MSLHSISVSIGADAPLELHCGHDSGAWSVAIHDKPRWGGGIAVYLRGTADELEHFAEQLAAIARSLRIEEVAP